MGLIQTARVLAAMAKGAIRSTAGAIRRGITGFPALTWIRRRWAPLTSPESSTIYKVAKGSISAGAQQQALGESGTVNPADVPQVPPAGAPPGMGGTVSYDVRVQLIDPATGRQHWATVYVQSSGYLTFAQIAAEAGASVQEVVNDSDPRSRWVAASAGGGPSIYIAGIVNYR